MRDDEGQGQAETEQRRVCLTGKYRKRPRVIRKGRKRGKSVFVWQQR